MRRRENLPNRRIYLDVDKRSHIAAFDAQQAGGDTAADAAKNIGVPIANIFRWKAQIRQEHTRIVDEEQHALLTNAFCVLYGSPTDNEETYLEALFVLIAWLRCSSKPRLLDISVATLLIATAKARFATDRLSELPEYWVKTITRHIPLTHFMEICCITGPEESLAEFPDFWNGVLKDQPYDDRDELARMCWCVLALGNAPTGKYASLGKMFYLMNADVFKYKWRASRRTKEIFWKKHAATAPFVFVERFESPLDLSLNPQAADMLQKVEDLLRSHIEIKKFLRNVRFTVERLVEVMDPRALQAVRFPSFPDKIAPLEIKLPELTPSIISRLQTYRSAER